MAGAGLVYEARLSDAVVFDAETACGKGRLSDSFRNLLMSEQRPIIVARPNFTDIRTVCLAWDGGKEATRAVRTALPLLAKAKTVTILSAPEATTRDFEPGRLADFLAARDVTADVQVLAGSDAAACILRACAERSADLLVAGAYGHTRWREVIFGGVTKSLIADKAGPSLFLSH
jgi:nucleotide-binding universal stress UspA family protein